jgi:hypothetical protein
MAKIWRTISSYTANCTCYKLCCVDRSIINIIYRNSTKSSTVDKSIFMESLHKNMRFGKVFHSPCLLIKHWKLTSRQIRFCRRQGVEHIEMNSLSNHRNADLSSQFEIRLEQFQHQHQVAIKNNLLWVMLRIFWNMHHIHVEKLFSSTYILASLDSCVLSDGKCVILLDCNCSFQASSRTLLFCDVTAPLHCLHFGLSLFNLTFSPADLLSSCCPR